MARRLSAPGPRGARLAGAGWVLLALFALAMALYALRIPLVGERAFGELLADSFRARPWGIYPHAVFGALAIGLGPLQFLPAVRRRRPLHRAIGRVWVVASLVVGAVGLAMGLYAHGGALAQTGFVGMGLGTLVATLLAVRHVRAGRIARHRAWMTRAYAMIFSAVTFRLWLPVLVPLFGGDFDAAYGASAWLSWAGNLAVAEGLLRSRRPAGAEAVGG